MNDQTLAILVTTFIRDELLYKTIQNIVDNFPKDSILLIADQGLPSTDKDKQIETFKSKVPLEYFLLPFNCGLSYARNFLVKKASDLNIPYVLMSADSIQFTKPYNFQSFINFLEQDIRRGLIGFNLLGSKCPWEFLMELTTQGILFDTSTIFIEHENIIYKKCDIVRNIFLAKTNTLLNLWDNNLHLCEHEDAFITYKQKGYEVYWTNYISFKKISTDNSEEYKTHRSQFSEYQSLLKKKLNIKTWVIYSPEAMREIRNYKKEQNDTN